ncbi:MAG TPA: radical SAM protein [Microthrixaceae bacterium]|nr:radical SAM protein [Sorangium sp.]HTO01694.1 radical SAM protein [Microthrixaceae bacterium]
MTKLTKPLLVYVNVPFCASKCHFCDWVTEIPTSQLRLGPADPTREAFIAALCHQITSHGSWLTSRDYKPDILYWGGGTATILSCDEISQVGEALHATFDLSQLREATIEGSPETITPDKLIAFRNIGFRRVSLGIQSFNDDRLKMIGRAHDANTAIRALNMVKEAGFDDISIDLISGFPGQELQEFQDTLNITTGLPVNHVAVYAYRPTPGTIMVRRLRRGTAGSAELSVQKACYTHARQHLEGAGLHEYAFGHFGSPRCHSDMAYFRLEQDWVGFGSGATSLIDGEFLAFERGQLASYLAAPTRFDERCPASAPRIAPRLAYQALTTHDGIVRTLWEQRLKQPLEDVLASAPVGALLSILDSLGGLERDSDGIRLPPEVLARAFIHLLYINTPEQARTPIGTEALFGWY